MLSMQTLAAERWLLGLARFSGYLFVWLGLFGFLRPAILAGQDG
jgi:hypothetical protein